ncbi:MAG: hypothetical protein IID44_20895 [Planctomycetes bacterium]|nr:hypothetical protein [Planctomycetota bacterium]
MRQHTGATPDVDKYLAILQGPSRYVRRPRDPQLRRVLIANRQPERAVGLQRVVNPR